MSAPARFADYPLMRKFDMKYILPAIVAVAATSSLAADAQTQHAALAGTWTPVSARMGGKDFPVAAFQGAKLVMTTSTYVFSNDSGTYKVLSLDTPARMEIRGETGPNAGKTIPAIYKLDGDELIISYQLGQGEQPTDFSSPSGTMVLVIRYARSS
jgi:uncharacterized protein (TIGR03067 family)